MINKIYKISDDNKKLQYITLQLHVGSVFCKTIYL